MTIQEFYKHACAIVYRLHIKKFGSDLNKAMDFATPESIRDQLWISAGPIWMAGWPPLPARTSDVDADVDAIIRWAQEAMNAGIRSLAALTVHKVPARPTPTQDAPPSNGKRNRVKKTIDGPRPPNKFHCGLRVIDMQPKPWMLLNFLWHSRTRSEKIEDAERVVWGEEPESDGRLKSTITRINSALSEAESPLRVRRKGIYLSLN